MHIQLSVGHSGKNLVTFPFLSRQEEDKTASGSEVVYDLPGEKKLQPESTYVLSTWHLQIIEILLSLNSFVQKITFLEICFMCYMIK